MTITCVHYTKIPSKILISISNLSYASITITLHPVNVVYKYFAPM